MRGMWFMAAVVASSWVGTEARAQDDWETPVARSGEQYLPYGQPIPREQALDAPPQPYDEAIHGRAHPNTQPQANEVGRNRARLPERAQTPRPGGQIPDIFPGSGDRGFWIWSGQGIFAANDAQTDLVIPDNAIGTTIYAPTHMPAGNACVETVTAHWRYSGMSTTSHAHGFWDHCGLDGATGWQNFEYMDATWKSKYARIYDGEERYFTESYKDGNGCWHGLMYNFNLGSWEEKVSPAICGSSSFATGWTMWESHHLMDQAQVCPAFPRIRASGLQLWTGSTWAALDTSNTSNLGPYGLCWTSSTYKFQVNVVNSDWTGLTP
ncbi:hypothetical protein ATI61_104219 [Archangium gephyra]|uniref:Uncharacterized protein n=1 Tax=Archangium gephyra TaxID=48 RepID=A0AAC8Q3L9_9BACT|nr:hypothetical protein [Archangium gephyra]AKJ00374.1 Hypothetical protein AA314_02000 [Archangium gephyra]REG32929.1 hypothetical protein ATI61_104219 [Archangium gephyra]